jgi:hypothetical protein
MPPLERKVIKQESNKRVGASGGAERGREGLHASLWLPFEVMQAPKLAELSGRITHHITHIRTHIWLDRTAAAHIPRGASLFVARCFATPSPGGEAEPDVTFIFISFYGNKI